MQAGFELLIFFAGLVLLVFCFARMCHEEGMDDDVPQMIL